MKRLAVVLCLIVIGVFLAGCAAEEKPEGATTPKVEVKPWSWATCDPSCYAYRVVTGIFDAVKDDVPGYEFSVKPYSSTTAAIKGFCNGEAESAYIADLAAKNLYESTGSFEGFVCEQKPVQTFWAYTMETFLVTTKENAENIRSWSDLDGKSVYLTPAGYMNHLNLRRAFAVLGVEPQHTEVDSKFVCKALEEGTIVATGLYTTAGVSLPTWGQELTIACKDKLVVIKMSDEEKQKIMAKYGVKEIDVSKWGIEGTADAVPFYFGFHTSLNTPEDAVYNLLKALEKNSDKLAQVDPGLEPLAKNVAEFQVGGIKSADPSVMPIHPGLAKYLKEKGLWNSEWDQYIAK
ncbi:MULTISPECIES: TAXI family TRAP transporter solute-binding subunit [Archaeoglobus]|uniref:Immunogenic protein (Bcsp31-3) n=2 Tax=Archaeoglobus fulgidus TaxID=2234 RepID=O29274_ARCFU|nr:MULTISPECIES: TAXI family TRAP transporter solute-binding subunit [Archaeoglobus]AAB90255.1 immunogenic protein (bcsp31-3) [Archaeoglobus fulgidus DSM 4304]KUJ92760.1 MAG: Immunogenic protein (Bcsp31-3) [Archaeoglobus fulgidus]KUK05536.1 MAG: Immunogenic protein (Bcsp31-3) [Archaeoglobus fulgidus]MDI3497953.1 uncharacterized protein [Archaeoglobus sp.]